MAVQLSTDTLINTVTRLGDYGIPEFRERHLAARVYTKAFAAEGQ